MEDSNIIIKIQGQADFEDAKRQSKEYTDRLDELSLKMKDLNRQEKEKAADIRALNLSRKEQTKALQENERYYQSLKREVKDEETALRKNISTLNNAMRTYQMVEQGAGKLTMQVRAIREELARMEQAGDTSSQRFIELSVQAARLTDQMGDTQRQIAILASDTKNLDAAMSLGSGLAGAFTVATSAAALLGDENEELQKAFLKVQMVMQTLNGVQQVANALNKDSAANVVIRTALQKLNAKATEAQTAATGKATIAQRIYNKVLLANPAGIVVIAIAALAFAYSKLTSAIGKTSDAQAKLNKQQTEQQIQTIQETTERELTLMKERGSSELEQLQTQQDAAAQIYNAKLQQYWKARELMENANMFTARKRGEELTQANQELLDAEAEYNKATAAVELQIEVDKIRATKKKNEERKQSEKDAAAELVRINKALRDTNTALIADEEEREIQSIQNRLADEQAQYKGKGAELAQIRSNLERKAQADIAAVRAKYKKQREDDEKAQTDKLRQQLEQQNAAVNRSAKTEIDALERTVKSSKSTAAEKQAAQEELQRRTLELQQNQLTQLETMHDAGLISEEEYLQRKYELNKQYTDTQLDYELQAFNARQQIMTEALNTLGELVSTISSAMQESYSQQLQDLDHYYTTDAEEAAANADKKYMSEKELEARKLAIRQQSARAEKAAAIFSIGLDTAKAIMAAWADATMPLWGKAAMTAMIATTGATQLGIAASKPLPKYAKGRKGGKAEFALVGEKGPEIVYLPQGSSVIPNNMLSTMYAGAANSPSKSEGVGGRVSWLNTPLTVAQAFAGTQPSRLRQISSAAETPAYPIDYDKLGQIIAQNTMQQQERVIVNVDRNGVTTTQGNRTTRHLNQKYSGRF